MTAFQFFVGIDVSKDTLDVCVLPTGEVFQVGNDTAGITELLTRLRPLSPERVVMEATGGYETEAAVTLFLARFKVCVVNPLQVRNFAKADGQFAKTDRIDAAVIAKFGQRMVPALRDIADMELREIDGLVTRRRQLLRAGAARCSPLARPCRAGRRIGFGNGAVRRAGLLARDLPPDGAARPSTRFFGRRTGGGMQGKLPGGAFPSG